LDSGADDYVTKPFGMMELVSRIRAVLRRTGVVENHEVYSYKSVVLDTRKHSVTVKDRVVDLTLKEFELLKLLMKNAGAVLTRDMLLENIWGYDFDSETRTVDVHIRTLRQKLSDEGKIIETVRGVGYRLGGTE
jgi:two-component system alkaline phosphatase synthesis response regulator PhoP